MPYNIRPYSCRRKNEIKVIIADIFQIPPNYTYNPLTLPDRLYAKTYIGKAMAYIKQTPYNCSCRLLIQGKFYFLDICRISL